jgi:hypothetical protein
LRGLASERRNRRAEVRVVADFVCSVQPGAADDVAFDGAERVIEGEVGWQAGVPVFGAAAP